MLFISVFSQVYDCPKVKWKKFILVLSLLEVCVAKTSDFEREAPEMVP